MRRFIATLALCLAVALPALATTKLGEFKDHSAALKAWFKAAQPTEWAKKQYDIYYCCEMAERVKTKFNSIWNKGSNVGVEEWWFECTEETAYFCNTHDKKIGEWAQVPPGVIHKEGIGDPKRYVNPQDGSKAYVGDDESRQIHNEFETLRTEGVMFVYRGDIVCFWPPEAGG